MHLTDHSLNAADHVVRVAPTAGRTGADWTRLNIALFAVLFAITLLPVMATPIPAMVDYVNHLARMYVLAADGTPGASPFYQVKWALYPNLAMDLVVPRLARVTGVEAAARTFLLASQVLIVAGAVAIELAVKRRFAFAGYAALLLLYSVPFAWGFVNFEFGLGVALVGFASWLALREREGALRLLVHAAFVALLFVAHLFALGLYGFAVGVHELWSARTRRSPLKMVAATMAMLATPVLPFFILMRASGGSVGQGANYWLFAAKPLWLVATLNGYSIVLSAVGSLALYSLVYALGRRRFLRLEASGLSLLAGFGLLYLAIPSRMLDTAFADLRVIVAAALIVPSFLTIRFPDDRWRLGTIFVVASVILANAGFSAQVAWSYDDTYRAMIASFGKLKKGARVLVAHSGANEDPPLSDLSAYPIYHAPTLAVHYADAFVPTLFTCAGKQPIELRADLRELANACGGPVPMSELKAVAVEGAPGRAPKFVQNWPQDFDYVYAVGAPAANSMPDILAPMERNDRFTLYRVVRPMVPPGQ